jgi:hypothetical protein
MPSTFAVVQKRPLPVPIERFMEIMATLPGAAAGTLLMAHPKKDRPIGIFAEHLEEGVARSLFKHLHDHGVEAVIVAQEELSLPQAVRLIGATLRDEGLSARDSSGESHEIGWLAVKAGLVSQVSTEERVRTSEPHLQYKGDPEGYGHAEFVPSEYGYKKEKAIYLEILVSSPALRLEIRPETFDYAYLGPRLKPVAAMNFKLVLGDLKRLATQAEFNAAFLELCAGASPSAPAAEKLLLQRELRWYWWRCKSRDAVT